VGVATVVIWSLVAAAVSALFSRAAIGNWPDRPGVLVTGALLSGVLFALVAGVAAGVASGAGDMAGLASVVLSPIVTAVYLLVWAVTVSLSPAVPRAKGRIWLGIVVGFFPCAIFAAITSATMVSAGV